MLGRNKGINAFLLQEHGFWTSKYNNFFSTMVQNAFFLTNMP